MVAHCCRGSRPVPSHFVQWRCGGLALPAVEADAVVAGTARLRTAAEAANRAAFRLIFVIRTSFVGPVHHRHPANRPLRTGDCPIGFPCSVSSRPVRTSLPPYRYGLV